MIYKVLYQKDKIVNPRRETTKTLFLEADNVVAELWLRIIPPTTLNSSKN